MSATRGSMTLWSASCTRSRPVSHHSRDCRPMRIGSRSSPSVCALTSRKPTARTHRRSRPEHGPHRAAASSVCRLYHGACPPARRCRLVRRRPRAIVELTQGPRRSQEAGLHVRRRNTETAGARWSKRFRVGAILGTMSERDPLFEAREEVLGRLGVTGQHFCEAQRVRWLSAVALSEPQAPERLQRLVDDARRSGSLSERS